MRQRRIFPSLGRDIGVAGREVHYVNPNVLFPNLAIYRKDYFIDPAHLNDAGVDAFARLYAEIILASDLPDQFAAPQWAGRSTHFAPRPGLIRASARYSSYPLG
jgi:hypothetical protein